MQIYFVSFPGMLFLSALMCREKSNVLRATFSAIRYEPESGEHTVQCRGYINEPAIVDPFSCELLLSMFTSLLKTR